MSAQAQTARRAGPRVNPGKRRHQNQGTARVLARRVVVLQLVRQGLSVRGIAEELTRQGEGVSYQQVHRDLLAAFAELQEQQREYAEHHRTTLLEKAREMYRLAYPEAANGDARAIAVALKAIETEAKLLGVWDEGERQGNDGPALHVHFGADLAHWPAPERPLLDGPSIETTATPVATDAEGDA